jgi:hypothetical protein
MSDYPIPEDLKRLYELGSTHRAWVRTADDIATEDYCRIGPHPGVCDLIERIAQLEYAAENAALRVKVKNLEAEKVSLQSALDAQTAKFEGCPHSQLGDAAVCGCSYDKPSDVCALHAPRLRKSLEENAALRAKVERLSAPVKAALKDALFVELSTSYDCTRVWEAWSVGTMSEDDFCLVIDRLDEIVNSVFDVLIAARAQEPKEKP